jgi:tetratricopeptide (TPR) repeat protein
MDLTDALSDALDGLDADDWQRVVVAIQDADQYRAAAEFGDPVAASDLAWAIGRVGLALSAVGRPEHALVPLTECVERYRRLVVLRPGEFDDGLGRWLRTLRGEYRDLGRHDEELAVAREGLAVYRRLAEADPAYNEELDLELGWLAGTLSGLGRADEAVEAAAEHVAWVRRRPLARPDEVDFGLALALKRYADRLADVGRREEALAATVEVVDLYRRMAVEEPDDMMGDLAEALVVYSRRLEDVGRHHDAQAAYDEIVQIFRDLAATKGEPWMRRAVVAALINNGVMLGRVGRYDEGLARATEAAELARSLIEGGPVGSGPVEGESSLSSALNNASVDLIRLNRYGEAVSAATEAVEIKRRLAASDPAGHEPDLAMALNNLAGALSGLGRHADAVAASAESYALYRRLVNTGSSESSVSSERSESSESSEYEADWADCLETFAAVRLAAGVERAEALRAAEESVAIYERLVDEPRVASRLDDAVRTRTALLDLDA